MADERAESFSREENRRSKDNAEKGRDGLTLWQGAEVLSQRKSGPAYRLKGIGGLTAAFDVAAATAGYMADREAGMSRDEAGLKNYGPFAGALLGSAMGAEAGPMGSLLGGALGAEYGRSLYYPYVNLKGQVGEALRPYSTPMEIYKTTRRPPFYTP